MELGIPYVSNPQWLYITMYYAIAGYWRIASTHDKTNIIGIVTGYWKPVATNQVLSSEVCLGNFKVSARLDSSPFFVI